MAMQNRSRPTSAAIGGLRKGCSGGPRCWYLVGSGRPPAPRARLRRVWPSWARQGPVNRFGPCKGSWRDGGKSGRGCFRVRRATHTPPAHHACARARDTGAATRTSWSSARMRAAAQQSRGRGGRCTRPRVTMGTRPRTTRTSRFLDAARGAAGGRQRLDRRVPIGGIKKKRPKKRAKGERSQRQRQDAARPG